MNGLNKEGPESLFIGQNILFITDNVYIEGIIKENDGKSITIEFNDNHIEKYKISDLDDTVLYRFSLGKETLKRGAFAVLEGKVVHIWSSPDTKGYELAESFINSVGESFLDDSIVPEADSFMMVDYELFQEHERELTDIMADDVNIYDVKPERIVYMDRFISIANSEILFLKSDSDVWHRN